MNYRISSTISCLLIVLPSALVADHTAQPDGVAVVGSLQSELGCPGDWQPECPLTELTFDGEDQVWQQRFTLPAGAWEYKAALNDTWDENYGAGGMQNGANLQLLLPDAAEVKVYYSHASHWLTDSVNSAIAVAIGSFQSELGCAGDWDPGCLRTWLQDSDGDSVSTLETGPLPSGAYEVKVAINEGWDETYGQDGIPNGANIPFVVMPDQSGVRFSFDHVTKLLTIEALPAPTAPAFVTVAGSLQNEIGCPGDWMPDCTATGLNFDVEDAVWQGVFQVPAGSWEYKAALNNAWDENYGLNAQLNGPNIPLVLPAPTAVKFYYEHGTHWVADNWNSLIAVAAGSFQSELGCPGDWQPDCLRSWLQDPNGDGVHAAVAILPGGNYETLVAHGEGWDEFYGQNGEQNGANIPFTVPGSLTQVLFIYDSGSHVLEIQPDTDGDGVFDASDNCTEEDNEDQRDTDGDDIGNICDADLNQDCVVNFIDLGIMKSVFFSTDPDADFNGDGAVNSIDLANMKQNFFRNYAVENPSGIPNLCN